MTIRDEALREAERRFPLHWDLDTHSRIGTAPRVAFVSGAEWAASREHTEEQVKAALTAWQEHVSPELVGDHLPRHVAGMRAALRAAREV